MYVDYLGDMSTMDFSIQGEFLELNSQNTKDNCMYFIVNHSITVSYAFLKIHSHLSQFYHSQLVHCLHLEIQWFGTWRDKEYQQLDSRRPSGARQAMNKQMEQLMNCFDSASY